MFEEPNKENLNHFFEKVGDYEYKSRPATEKEIEAIRKDFKKGIKSGKYELMVIGRSCWVCNAAHTRLIDMPAMNCFSCGRIYHKGFDIVDYSGSELEKYSHLSKKPIKKTNEKG